MENITYADCPTCLSSQAVDASGYLADVTRFTRRLTGAGHITTCRACRTTFVAPTVRNVKIRRGPVSSRGCDGACLNGKTSCNCRCKGRCHGAGECHCG
jgi:hypothetical protein